MVRRREEYIGGGDFQDRHSSGDQRSGDGGSNASVVTSVSGNDDTPQVVGGRSDGAPRDESKYIKCGSEPSCGTSTSRHWSIRGREEATMLPSLSSGPSIALTTRAENMLSGRGRGSPTPVVLAYAARPGGHARTHVCVCVCVCCLDNKHRSDLCSVPLIKSVMIG